MCLPSFSELSYVINCILLGFTAVTQGSSARGVGVCVHAGKEEERARLHR